MTMVRLQDRCAALSQYAAREHADQRKVCLQSGARRAQQGHNAAVCAAIDERQAERGCRSGHAAQQFRCQFLVLGG